jgi:hypothetical protein
MIHCYSEEGKGTTFKLYFPMCFRKADGVGPKIETAPKGGSEYVLVVEAGDDGSPAPCAGCIVMPFPGLDLGGGEAPGNSGTELMYFTLGLDLRRLDRDPMYFSGGLGQGFARCGRAGGRRRGCRRAG